MPHHRRRRLPWASAAAPPEVLDGTRLSEPCGDQARCSTAAPEAMRVDVRELDAASVGARVGRSVRRLPRPPMPPSTTRFSYRGRWASGCLARWLIRGLRADMRTDD